jgi:general secretion pathway protein G
MEVASMRRLAHRLKPNRCGRPQGFSLLKMMVVVTLILTLASIATPICQSCPSADGRGRAARSSLHPADLIDRFTLDYGRAPLRLEELVEKGYLGRLPTNPFTGSNETW